MWQYDSTRVIHGQLCEQLTDSSLMAMFCATLTGVTGTNPAKMLLNCSSAGIAYDPNWVVNVEMEMVDATKS